MVDDLLRLVLRHSFETEAINVAERAAGTLPGSREVAVAFADLVGFTRLGEQGPPEDLGLIAGRLERCGSRCRDEFRAVRQNDRRRCDAGVRGAVATADDFVLDLVEAAAAAEIPRLRVGFAFGPAVSRSGDWYGSPVNLASRVTHAAPPGVVWLTESARQAIGDAAGIEWSFAGARHLRGVTGGVRLHAVRRIPAMP